MVIQTADPHLITQVYSCVSNTESALFIIAKCDVLFRLKISGYLRKHVHFCSLRMLSQYFDIT